MLQKSNKKDTIKNRVFLYEQLQIMLQHFLGLLLRSIRSFTKILAEFVFFG